MSGAASPFWHCLDCGACAPRHSYWHMAGCMSGTKRLVRHAFGERHDAKPPIVFLPLMTKPAREVEKSTKYLPEVWMPPCR